MLPRIIEVVVRVAWGRSTTSDTEPNSRQATDVCSAGFAASERVVLPEPQRIHRPMSY